MPRVEVRLNGRGYAVSCRDGEQDRLLQIAAFVDERIRQVAASGSGQGSDAHLLALTALLLADELFDIKAGGGGDAANRLAPQEEEAVVSAVDQLARRIEDIAARLDRP
ncbi:MAG: cell division protein ZapA [Azospirillaceae bacterium]|nr:cell division protein ZapA [Azospirillaceae bacterium]